ncbi:MAG: uroporphyrinogen decarboxylase [Candidatus Thorarchaeota archaeon]
MSQNLIETHNKLLLEAIYRKKSGPVPVWFMRQAGRYLPEYQEVRKSKTFEEMIQNPEIVSEVTLQPVKRFDLDAAIIFSDILVPFYYINRNLKILPEKGPVLENPLRNPKEINTLPIINPEEDYPYLKESIRKVKNDLPKNKSLIGFSGAPFTLASYLIEGKSTKDAFLTKIFALKYPNEYDALLTYISDIIISQLEAQVLAGVDIVQIFDSWALYLTPDQYHRFAFPYTKRIISSPRLSNIPKIHFAQGTAHLIDHFINTKPEVLSLDSNYLIKTAVKKIPSHIAVQGNLDPAYLLSNKNLVRKETNHLLNTVKTKNNYIFNLGKGIHKDTPVENVQEMVDTIKEYNTQFME